MVEKRWASEGCCLALKAVIHASEVLTGLGVRAKDGRRIVESDLNRIEDGAVVYSTRKAQGDEVPDRIEWVGPTSEMPSDYQHIKKQSLQLQQAIVPGLVDCHTHLVFAGNRADEFARRCGGESYEQIAASGGGIMATVHATRTATAQELETLAHARMREAYSYGTRTIEIKSGYGLSAEAELKILETIRKLKRDFPKMTIHSTFLGAHAFPSDMKREEYLRLLTDQMLPKIAQLGLADSCDVFVDQGYYTLEDGREILALAKKLGLRVRIHADELYDTSSAQMASEMGALSADHLLKISDAGIQAIAQSETVAVLLPGTAFYLKEKYAPARKLIDAGAAVAIATDFNPGTCMTLNLPAMMTLAALYMGMTRAEVFAAVTYNAAKALGLQEKKGTLAVGMDADFTILPFARFEEMYYRFAWSAN